MSGLYGTLNLGARALQAQSKGLAVAGQNLANVNNPAYSRQRLVVQTTSAIPTPIGSEGTGVSAVAIQRLHDTLLDRQIQSEASNSGYWSAQQSALRSAQIGLGEALDGTASGADGTAAAASLTGSSSLASDLAGLFGEFQNLAASPASIPQRANLLARAQGLAGEFQRTDARLASVEATLNRSIEADTKNASQLLGDIARLNDQIRRAEAGSGNGANDLRDLRQGKLEALSRLTNLEAVEEADGQVTISVGGEILVSGKSVVTNLVAQDPGNGRLQVATGSGVALTLTGGSLQGSLEARDTTLASLRSELNTLASTLATEVNAVHAAGFNLAGGTGAEFFTGNSAATLRVNPALVSDPSLVQASGTPGATGDNQTALALARLADRPIAGLGQQTFSDAYARTVAATGEALAHANTQVEDQLLVDNLLLSERDSTSGVSIDEEMADLVRYQKAFQASARIVSVVDAMLDEVIQMAR